MSGFSLLELLTVITTVTILVCVVVPSLGRAGEYTRKEICATHLRQLGVALRMYATEDEGWYPVEELCGNPHCALVGGLYPRYVDNRGLFYCPSADQVEPYAQSDEFGGPGGDSVIDTDDNWQRHYITYKYFSVTRRDTRMPLPLKLSDYPHLLKDDCPSQRWLMSDWVRKDVPVFPHYQKGGWGGGRNVLFADTSVRFVRHQTPYAFGD
ncbi:MAG: hypothetical protein SVT52_05015 [Planctomycetota bacterium]|nr:hypothetical protein [Planctomycetota bacterium]